MIHKKIMDIDQPDTSGINRLYYAVTSCGQKVRIENSTTDNHSITCKRCLAHSGLNEN